MYPELEICSIKEEEITEAEKLFKDLDFMGFPKVDEYCIRFTINFLRLIKYRALETGYIEACKDWGNKSIWQKLRNK